MFKIVTLGGKSSDFWSKISCYGEALAEPLNAICDHKADDSPLHMTVLIQLSPFLTHFFSRIHLPKYTTLHSSLVFSVM